MNLNGFNAEEHKSAGFEPLPVGEYLATIVATEEKSTKAGDGSYLKLEFEILEGDYKGRKLWENLNLKNKSADAERIAKGQLSAICKAVGVLSPKDSVDLHNIPMLIRVGIEVRKDNNEAQNRIKGFKTRPGIGEQAAGSVMPSKTPAKQSAGSTAPWAKK